MSKGPFNEFAIAAFTLGLLSFVQVAGLEKAIAAIVFGVLALKRIAAPDNSQRGEGLAAASIVLGVIYMIIAVAFLVAMMKNPQLLQDLISRSTAQ